jgi:hypothetical protein
MTVWRSSSHHTLASARPRTASCTAARASVAGAQSMGPRTPVPSKASKTVIAPRRVIGGYHPCQRSIGSVLGEL